MAIQCDDFQRMDAEAGKSVVCSSKPTPALAKAKAGDFVQMRKDKVTQYYADKESPAIKMKRGDLDGVLMTLISELVDTGDNLLGNELLATENGDFRDATVIAVKRAEVIEKILKVIQAKQACEKENGIDVESPSMLVVFRYFISKTKEALVKIGVADELADTFYKALGELSENWKKDLRLELEAMRKTSGNGR